MKDILINNQWYENLPDIVVDTIIAQDDHIKELHHAIRALKTKEHTAKAKKKDSFWKEYNKVKAELYAFVGCSVKQGELLK